MLGHPQLQDARTADRTTVGCGRQWRWPARSQPCRLRACRCPLPRCQKRTVHLGFHWLRAATWATPSSPQLGRPLDDTPRARRRKLRSFRSVLRAHSSGQGNTLTVGAATKKSLKLSTVEAPHSWHAPARLFGWRAEPSLGPRPPKPRDLLCAILYAPRTVITRRCTTAPDSLGFRGFVKEIRSRKSFSCSCAKPRRRCELRAMAGVDSNVHPSGPSSSTELLCKADALPTTTRIYSKASAEPGDPHDTWARNPMIGEGNRGSRNPVIQLGSQAVKHPIPAGSPARSPPSARVLAPACASGGSAAAPSATSAEAATPWRPLRLGQVPPPRPRGQPPRRLVQGPPPDEPHVAVVLLQQEAQDRLRVPVRLQVRKRTARCPRPQPSANDPCRYATSRRSSVVGLRCSSAVPQTNQERGHCLRSSIAAALQGEIRGKARSGGRRTPASTKSPAAPRRRPISRSTMPQEFPRARSCAERQGTTCTSARQQRMQTPTTRRASQLTGNSALAKRKPGRPKRKANHPRHPTAAPPVTLAKCPEARRAILRRERQTNLGEYAAHVVDREAADDLTLTADEVDLAAQLPPQATRGRLAQGPVYRPHHGLEVGDPQQRQPAAASGHQHGALRHGAPCWRSRGQWARRHGGVGSGPGALD
jgi:hypothetical protein